MNHQQENTAPDGGPDEHDEVCVLDAVACVHFAGANLNHLLVAALSYVGWVILVPEEVCDEVKRKDAKYPGLRRRWLALQRTDRVRVLPALRADSAPARVIEVLEDIRFMDFDQCLAHSRDLGECVVVAHGVHLREQGRAVTLLMDDRGGQRLAGRQRLPFITVEDVMAIAVQAGCFASMTELKNAYARLEQFGSGLADFATTGLADRYLAWSADDAKPS